MLPKRFFLVGAAEQDVAQDVQPRGYGDDRIENEDNDSGEAGERILRVVRAEFGVLFACAQELSSRWFGSIFWPPSAADCRSDPNASDSGPCR